MSIGKLLQRPVLTLPPDASCIEAARLMDREEVGAVVVEVEGRPLGMVTDRDLALRVMAKGLNPKEVRLHEVMTGAPIYLSERRGLDEFIGYMQEMAVRRIMAVDAEGRLIGLLSLDDLLLLLAEQLGSLAKVVKRSVSPPPRPAKPLVEDLADD